MKQQWKQRISPWVLQWVLPWTLQWPLPWIKQWIRRRPLWFAFGVCALGGLFFGVMLSKTVPHTVSVTNAAMPNPTPSGLRQSSLMFTEAPARPRTPVKQTKAGSRKGMVAQKAPRLDRTENRSDCAASPQQSRNSQSLMALQNLPINRFRTTAGQTRGPVSEQSSVAHHTNFGWRFLADWKGRSALHEPIVVLHETVGSFESAMNVFSSDHPDDEEQVSYHAVIRESGDIVYIVPPEYRAYGAGDSVFVNSAYQEETVQTKEQSPPSVNNFAYHISLVTPEEGQNDEETHEGYTKNQYEALAWLVSKTGIPDDRVTTHRLVDRSGSRIDPRSFNAPYFLSRLHAYPRTQEVVIGCTLLDSPPPPDGSKS
jgi:hypothetical protein